jgi:uncharacterized protein YjbI with pentapeptide repeats
MDEYLFNFVLDEIILDQQQNPKNVVAWQQTLCHLISFMLQHGMPMERLSPRPDFQEENRQAVNAEETLLAVLNACARSTNNVSNIQWTSKEALGAWILKLQGPRPANVVAPVVKYLSWMNLQECYLPYKDLFGANLEGAHLYGADLYRAHLYGAHLEGADLEGANLERANLEGAHLEGADLEGADLEGADLEGADLEGNYS